MPDTDLCQTCTHYWLDFPMPLDRYVPHCEILDTSPCVHGKLDEIVPCPCLKCPFGCYEKQV